MADLDTTVAVYKDRSDADLDWTLLEDGVQEEQLDIADAALVENQAGEAVILERHSRHGWGKGAVAGAVVGVLFPPSLIGMAAVGAGGGELVGRFHPVARSGKVKDLGDDRQGFDRHRGDLPDDFDPCRHRQAEDAPGDDDSRERLCRRRQAGDDGLLTIVGPDQEPDAIPVSPRCAVGSISVAAYPGWVARECPPAP